jgi:hypothetical protein
MRRNDPLERLRAVNPVPVRTVLPAPDRVLLHQIVSGLVPAAPPPRTRVPRLVPVAVVIAALFGGTVAYALLRGGVTKPQTVACYAEADLEARTEVVGVGDEGPVAACAELWRRGVLGAGGGAVPPLEECVLDSGVAGVFPATPGRGACTALIGPPTGPSTTAPPPQPPPADVNSRVLALRDALLPQFLEVPCVEPRVAADIVRRELERAGLGDWTIRGSEGSPAEGYSAQRPCASLSFSPESREVVLVPSVPRR